jgi:hypothetical protein
MVTRAWWPGLSESRVDSKIPRHGASDLYRLCSRLFFGRPLFFRCALILSILRSFLAFLGFVEPTLPLLFLLLQSIGLLLPLITSISTPFCHSHLLHFYNIVALKAGGSIAIPGFFALPSRYAHLLLLPLFVALLTVGYPYPF